MDKKTKLVSTQTFMKSVLAIGGIILLASCNIGNSPDKSEITDVDFNQLAESNLEFLIGAQSTPTAQYMPRLSVAPLWLEGYTEIKSGVKQNYPWVGQTTEWQVTAVDSNLYKIDSRTSFNQNAHLSYYQEVYYILDANGNGVWDSGDQYADPNGFINSLHRDTMRMVYSDGFIRDEEIVWDSNQEGTPGGLRTTLRSNTDHIAFFNDADFSSVVEYSIRDTRNATMGSIDGRRVYANKGDGTEMIWVHETGFFVNLILNGIHRGRANIEGWVVVEVVDGVPTVLFGQYTISSANGRIEFVLPVMNPDGAL